MLSPQTAQKRVSALILGSLCLPLSGCGREPEAKQIDQLRSEFAEVIATTRKNYRADVEALRIDMGDVTEQLGPLKERIATLEWQLRRAAEEQSEVINRANNILSTMLKANLPPTFIDAGYQLRAPLEFTESTKLRMRRSIIEPSVRIASNGSGTIIYCGPPSPLTNLRLIAILTARHVVRDATVGQGSSHVPVFVSPGAKQQLELHCRELCRSDEGDASIIFAFTEKELPVARFVGKLNAEDIQELDGVALSGCPDLLPPVLTFGHIGLRKQDYPNDALKDDVVVTSGAYFGNSGGGAYTLKPNGEGHIFGVLTKIPIKRDKDEDNEGQAVMKLSPVPHLAYVCGPEKIRAMMAKVGLEVKDDGQAQVTDTEKLNEALRIMGSDKR